MTFRLYLRYDPATAQPNTWRMGDGAPVIRVRARIASGPETVTDVPVVELRLKAHDSETWISRPRSIEAIDSLGPIELVLRGAPEHVMRALRELTR